MSKGSRPPSWKVVRNRFAATGRELARLAAEHTPAPVQGPALPPLPSLRAPRPQRQARRRKEPTAREAAIRTWYLYGEADDEPPYEDIGEEELLRIRERFCT